MARTSLTPFRFGGLGPAEPFFSLHREMNRLFEDALRGGDLPQGSGQSAAASFLAPQINVSESENEIRITAELPGVNENDVEITLNDDALVIRGEKKIERKDERENFHVVERSFGTFQRTLRLPFPVDPDQVRASFDNGVLTVTLPKSAQRERSRKIQVTGGGAGSSAGQIGGASGGAAEPSRQAAPDAAGDRGTS